MINEEIIKARKDYINRTIYLNCPYFKVDEGIKDDF